MAEVTAFRNNATPYPIYGMPWVVVFPMLDEDGDPVTGLTCDSEVSLNGDTGADCTNEAVEIPYTTATNKGMYYLILTAAEMTADIVAVTVYSGATTTQATAITLYPRKLVSIRSGTAAGGDTGYITLDASASANDDFYNGMVCKATIDSNVEVRVITDYTGSNKQAAVTPAWNVAPDNDDTFVVYLPEGVQVNQANVTHISGTAQTARDIGTSVLLSSGTGTGQLDFTSGVAKANLVQVNAAAQTATLDTIKAETVLIVADTGEMQTDLANGGRLDLLIDAIKAVTDNSFNVTGTAAAGAAGTITLAAHPRGTATDNTCRGQTIAIMSGTGAGQARVISAYAQATKVATIIPNWTTTPDNSSVYVIFPQGSVNVEQWVSAVVLALVSGRPNVSVGAVANNAITAASIAAAAIDNATFAADVGSTAYATNIVALAADKAIANAALATATNLAAAKTVIDDIHGTDLPAVKVDTAAILLDTGTDGVLLSNGTGAGQLDFTSGVVKANLAQILGTALTETSGLIAAGFKKFFNIATPLGTINSLPGANPGEAGGLPLVAAGGLKLGQTVDLTAGQSIAANGGTVATVTTLTNLPTIPNDWIAAAGVKADAVTKIQTGLATPTNITAGTITTVTTVTNAPTGMALEATLTAMKGAGWTTETLKALADAITNLDGDVADVFDDVGDVKTELDLVHAKTNNLPTDPADQSAVEAAITAGIATIPAGITADDVLDEVITGFYTMRQLIALFAAKLHGTAAGGNTDTITYDSLDGITTSVIVETVDEDGNRTVVLTV